MLSELAEKQGSPSLPLHRYAGISSTRTQNSTRNLLCCIAVSAACLLLFQSQSLDPLSKHYIFEDDTTSDLCPQVKPWTPDHTPVTDTPDALQLAQVLSGAVQVNTSVYDDDPTVAERPDHWEAIFTPFHRYLQEVFPLSHSDNRVSLELVNHYGLLYTWKGSNDSLEPLILMAHQDVVPVEMDTLDQWAHPPFSGTIDLQQEVVYGRGAGDDKVSLISILASFESLLRTDYSPNRTIILSFGFDEETRGVEGGEALARRLEEIYGRHDEGKGAMMIVDEGEGVDDSFGIRAAMPAIAEKGYLDVRISVQAKGGHSSEPPPHTSIGILSKLISAIEDQPPSASMSMSEDGPNIQDSPGLKMLLCLSDSPKMKKSRLGMALQRLIRERRSLANRHSCSYAWHRLLRICAYSKERAHRALNQARKDVIRAAYDAGFKGTFATTQAMDLIKGGTKVNALPELAQAVLNLRINVDATVQSERSRLMEIVEPISKKMGCRLDHWGNMTRPNQEYACVVTLADAFDSALEPAPMTPMQGDQAAPFFLLSSVIRKVWQSDSGNDEVRVIPTMMEGNTDTKSYHNLSRHIFRFSPGSFEKMEGPKDGGIHTVDEKVQIDALVKGVGFYTSLIKAVQ